MTTNPFSWRCLFLFSLDSAQLTRWQARCEVCIQRKSVLETNPERYIYSLMNRSRLLYSYVWNSICILHTICGACVCTGGEYEWENDCCNCAHEHLLCIEILCCHNFNILNVYTLSLTVSFVSFRQCKDTAIFFRFQEKSPILLKLVWTIAWPLDKSAKPLEKVSKKWRFPIDSIVCCWWVLEAKFPASWCKRRASCR